MTRQNIDFGIDLGTTNSAVAVSDAGAVDVLRNNENIEFTPSAVTLSASGTVRVGRRARERVEDDPDNAKSEFKARMGLTDAVDTFTASGVSMTPVELSAEVLKSLKNDVRTRRDENLDAAVVTIPAAFGIHQVDATHRAAELAGITAETLQEPTAAAYAYLHREQREIDRAFWLVYDFGGGTFDAAVMNLREGECKQIAHHGDNHLGGKNIDWAVVDQILLPAVRRQLGWTDIGRGEGASTRWSGAVAKLKAAAEEAKISLSGLDRTEIVADLAHDDGRSGTLEIGLTRAELERLAEPFYRRSVELARKALENAGLRDPRDVEKVLLVGGTTIAPAVQRLLADPVDGLGIAIDHSIDPVTVVARGAAVYASTQLRSASSAAPPAAGTASLQLRFEPVGDHPRPLVKGTVAGLVDDWTGHTVQFRNPAAQPPWEGPRLPLGPDGTFHTDLHAQEGTNTYPVELLDPRGTRIPTAPDQLVYRLDLQVPANQTVLPTALGIGLADRTMGWLVAAGADISHGHRQTQTVRTTQDVSRAAGSGVIAIPVLQGDKDRPDRNRRVGKLEITARDVRRDVPAGTEVEVTVQVDASQNVVTGAYVPFLDQDWEIEIELGRTTPGPAQLQVQITDVEQRIADLEHRTRSADDHEAGGNLAGIGTTEKLAEIKRLRSTSVDDPADGDACESRLFELQVALDGVEDAILVPEQMAELDQIRAAIDRQPLSSELRSEYESVNAEVEQARRDGDLRALRAQEDVLRRILGRAFTADPDFHRKAFGTLRGIPPQDYTDAHRAVQLVSEGERAVRSNDHGRLEGIVGELASLLPPYHRAQVAGVTYDDSTVRK